MSIGVVCHIDGEYFEAWDHKGDSKKLTLLLFLFKLGCISNDTFVEAYF